MLFALLKIRKYLEGTLLNRIWLSGMIVLKQGVRIWLGVIRFMIGSNPDPF
jgi:hypothetical protein